MVIYRVMTELLLLRIMQLKGIIGHYRSGSRTFYNRGAYLSVELGREDIQLSCSLLYLFLGLVVITNSSENQ